MHLKKLVIKNLWKLLIDLDMNKKELGAVSGISLATLTKLTKGECVNMDMLVKICIALDCDLHDIVEIVSEDDNEMLKRKIVKLPKSRAKK